MHKKVTGLCHEWNENDTERGSGGKQEGDKQSNYWKCPALCSTLSSMYPIKKTTGSHSIIANPVIA